jgi:hypothetical protein
MGFFDDCKKWMCLCGVVKFLWRDFFLACNLGLYGLVGFFENECFNVRILTLPFTFHHIILFIILIIPPNIRHPTSLSIKKEAQRTVIIPCVGGCPFFFPNAKESRMGKQLRVLLEQQL